MIALTNSSGNLNQGPYVYDPYGNCFDNGNSGNPCSSGEPYRFTGRRFDPETGLLYYRARYYSPVIGRFLQTDPVGYTADLNLYTYVGNDPTDRADPTGNCTPERCAADYDFNGIQAVDVTYSWNGQSGITGNLRPDIGSLRNPAGSRATRSNPATANSGATSRRGSDTNGVSGANSSCPGCFMVAANGGIPQVTLNRAQHEAEVARQAQWLRNKGLVVTLNVGFIGRNGVPVTVDYVVSQWLPDGFGFTLEPMYAADVKTGNGPLTGNQSQVYPSMGSGSWVTPVGVNAAAAGFTIDEEVYIPIVYGAQLSTTSH